MLKSLQVLSVALRKKSPHASLRVLAPRGVLFLLSARRGVASVRVPPPAHACSRRRACLAEPSVWSSPSLTSACLLFNRGLSALEPCSGRGLRWVRRPLLTRDCVLVPRQPFFKELAGICNFVYQFLVCFPH